MLLTPGGERTRTMVEDYVASIALDAQRVSQAAWKWPKGSVLVVSDSPEKGRKAYCRLHAGMTDRQAVAALETVSARKP